MTRRRGAALALVASLFGLLGCGRSEPPASEAHGTLVKDARALIVRYDDAWKAKDVKALDKILAPEYVYFSSLGGESDLAKTRETVASPAYRLERGERSEIRAFRIGTTVVVSTRWQGAGVFDGKSFQDDQRCSVVVGFADGRGRVLSEHCTNIPPK